MKTMVWLSLAACGAALVNAQTINFYDVQAGATPVGWRAQDKDNYYIARANALEDNVTIYHTINGKRVSFKNVNTKVSPNQWHTLHVDFAGNKFTVAFD